MSDPEHVLPYEPLQLKENLTYDEEPKRILERMNQTLRKRTIPFVKVLWRPHTTADATWEPEHVIQEKYPELFTASA